MNMKTNDDYVEEYRELMKVHQSNMQIVDLIENPLVEIRIPFFEEWLRTTLEEVRREERAETKNKFTQVIAGMPGRLFILPHNVEKVVGYIREDGIGDIAYKGKEIDLMTVVNETLALTPTNPDKQTEV